MASQVTVIDEKFRRHLIKVTPGKYLTEIRDEACSKLQLDPSQYGLKSNNKQVDLTRTYRLSGLPSGAKLDLVRVSRSPSAVSVALQVPDFEADGLPNFRLTEKFSSATSLWQIVRAFESGKAGESGVVKNFTGRGVPHTASGKSGAGRLYYQTPVIQIMGRDYDSFTDLQKTLSQIGFNDGSVLLKLSFKSSDTPLEEGIEQIDYYFNSLEQDQPAGAHAGNVGQAQSFPSESQPEGLEEDKVPDPPVPQDPGETPLSETLATTDARILADSSTPTLPLSETPTNSEPTASAVPLSTLSSITSRPITVFAPATSSTPQAAQQNHNPADYEPSIELMKSHQAHINFSTRNQRLLTNAEIAQKEQNEAQKLAKIQQIQIKIRFPDEYAVLAAFSADETASDLYKFVRQLLARNEETFVLRDSTFPKPRLIKEGEQKLTKDLKLTRNELLRFAWGDEVGLEAKRDACLLEEVRAQAQQVKVQDFGVGKEEENRAPNQGQTLGGKSEGKEKGKMKAVPKWLMKGLHK